MTAIGTTQITQLQLEQALNNNDTGTVPILKTTQASDLNTAGTHSMAAQGTNGWGYTDTYIATIET